MELGLQLFGCADYWRRDAAQCFERVRQMGYSSVEPCVWFGEGEAPHFAWDLSSLPAYARLLGAQGLTAPSCHVITNRPLSSLTDAMRGMTELGYRYFVIGGGAWDVCSVRALAKEGVALADELEKEGAEVWFHNGWKEFRRHICGKYAWEYFLDCAEGRIGAQFDTGWATYGGGDIGDILQRNAAKIRSVHHKDIQDAITPVKHLLNAPLGRGIADTEIAFAFGKRESLYQLVDLDNSEGDFMDALKQSADYLAQLENCGD